MSQMVMQAYRFALDPTPAQQRSLAAHAGAARFAFNWALAAVKANVGQRAAERSYGIAEDELTPALGWNLPALRRAWNQAKTGVASWWVGCSKEAFHTGLDGLARALRNFSESRSGKRAGRRVGFPRLRSRRRAVPSVRFTTGTLRVEADRKHITLPRLGAIKTHESTRKLARRIEAGTAGDPVGHGARRRWPLVLFVHRRGATRRASAGPAGSGGRCGRGHHAPGGALHRPDRAQPPSPRASTARTAFGRPRPVPP